jgi:hypothetical protein
MPGDDIAGQRGTAQRGTAQRLALASTYEDLLRLDEAIAARAHPG